MDRNVLDKESLKKFTLIKGDRILWVIYITLCVISLLVVYSSTASMAYNNIDGNTSYYLTRQIRSVLLGIFLVWVVHRIDIRHYIRFAPGIFKITIVLMLLAYVMGEVRNDAARWLPIPIIGGTFQPSDAIKVSIVMLLSLVLSKRQSIINKIPILPSLMPKGWRDFPHKNFDIWRRTTKPIIVPILVASAVVFPANLSTATIIFICSVMVLWASRVRGYEIYRFIKATVIVGVMVIICMSIMGVGRANTWVNRVQNYALPILGIERDGIASELDFQKIQAQIAIASGGILGKGPGNSTQRSLLPHPYSDFAFAFIVEEYGVIGAILVLLLYLWLFSRSRIIMYKSNSGLEQLLVFGLSLSIMITAFVHILVSVGILPVTGQTLPFVSWGGSSMIFNSIALGMILSISRNQNNTRALSNNKKSQESVSRGA